jgi:hypothetical protein
MVLRESLGEFARNGRLFAVTASAKPRHHEHFLLTVLAQQLGIALSLHRSWRALKSLRQQ